MRCCGTRIGCRASSRSACAASGAASAAPPRRCCRSASRSATCLALLSLGSGVAASTRGWFDDNHFDIWIQPQAGKVLDSGTGRAITGVDGVKGAQPWLSNAVKIGTAEADAWGLPARPLIDTRIDEGRWYSPADVARATRVAVLGRTIAKTAGSAVGDRITLSTANGPATFRVIGISANQANNGSVVFVPVSSLQSVLGMKGTFNNYFVTTTSSDHALIDRHDHATRGRPRCARRPGRHVRQLRHARAAGRRQRQDHDVDHRARPADRRDQHGRAHQRHHHGRPRAHARDRRAALDRRPRPRRAAHLRHRRARRRPARLGCSACRSATRWRARSAGWPATPSD